MSVTISGLRLASSTVSPRTRWTFLRLTSETGGFGLGELTGADPAALVAELTLLEPVLRGRPVAEPPTAVIADLHTRARAESDRTRGHTLAVLASALDLAWHDLAAREAGQPLWRHQDGRELGAVEVYANINRGLWDRTPKEFADKARAAVRDGFRRIKCAPFDHLPLSGAELRVTGLRLLAAVRDAIGDDIELYVDAHAKLPYAETLLALPEFERLNVRWLEDAVALDEPELWVDLRSRTSLRLVGGEQTYDAGDLLPALERDVFDVVLLDVKYVGGLTALRSLIELVTARGIPVSLHNPAGPVATAASVHATTLVPVDTILEFAYGETDWRANITDPAETVTGSRIAVPETPGLGVDLVPAYAEFVGVADFPASLRDTPDAH